MLRRTALVFPGQGSQRQGMMQPLPSHEALERLIDAAEALSELPLRQIAMLGTDEDLADTRVAQPLLYLADWAWGTALLDTGLRVHGVAGHSLGEIAALAVAEVFSVEAGLELVVERSRVMASTAAGTPGAMSAVLGMSADAVHGVVSVLDDVWVANDNADGQIVISGTAPAVATASEALTQAGARRIVELKVAGPFHSPLMEPARLAFADTIAGTDFRDAKLPVYQNTHPAAATDAEVIRERLLYQITAPVRWRETMAAFIADGIEFVIEAGPGSVLSGLLKRVDGLDAMSAESAGIDRILEEVS
jgi:[acyl-carrier-protein] S-malonyltransferase